MKFLKFLNARDRDWPIESRWLVVFDKEVEYKLKGKTHGVRSHAIKHLYEFSPEYILKIIDKIKTFLKPSECYVYSGTKFKEIHSVKEINWKWMLNTFDYINDKIENNELLNKTEKRIVPYLNQIVVEYKKVVDYTMEGAININEKTPKEINDLVNKRKTVMYDAKQGKFRITVWLDFSTFTLVIKDNKVNAITTTFNLKSLEKTKNWAKKKISKDMIVSDGVYKYFMH